MSTPRFVLLALAAVLLWPLLAGGGGAADPATDSETCLPTLAAGGSTLTLDVDGTRREVIVQVPVVEPGVRPPAVIAFHGYTSYAVELEESSGLSPLAAQGGFVVAYPQALGDPTEWHFQGNVDSDPRDVSLTEALIDALIDSACVDPERVVLAGHSMGAAMASDAACRLADRVAGVFPVAAPWFKLPCRPSRPVPVIAMHAVDDPVVPYEGGPLPDVPAFVPPVWPFEEAIGTWAGHDGCGPIPEEAAQADGSTVLTWPDCTAHVTLHRLPTGGHDWPVTASDLIVELLAATG
jgi:polyhydroxybutyrate depolymerase